MQRSAERLAKGNAKFFNLAVGDKVLFKDNFGTSNIFAKADWMPVRVTEIFPSSDCAVHTVTVQKEDGEERTLTTDKLAIVDEDLLEWYKKCQGLQTVHRNGNSNDEDEERILTTAGCEGLRASLQCDTSGDRATSAHTTRSPSNAGAPTGERASAGRRRGRPRGAKNCSWQGDPTRYRLRSSTTIEDDV
jgi:hypothetical protein